MNIFAASAGHRWWRWKSEMIINISHIYLAKVDLHATQVPAVKGATTHRKFHASGRLAGQLKRRVLLCLGQWLLAQREQWVMLAAVKCHYTVVQWVRHAMSRPVILRHGAADTALTCRLELSARVKDIVIWILSWNGTCECRSMQR